MCSSPWVRGRNSVVECHVANVVVVGSSPIARSRLTPRAEKTGSGPKTPRSTSSWLFSLTSEYAIMADDDTTATATPPEPEAAPPDAEKTADDGKLKQTVEITDVGPCKKHVKITVEREAIDERFKEKFDELLQDRTAPVPGFRPGKAPRKYIERKFKPAVAEDVR